MSCFVIVFFSFSIDEQIKALHTENESSKWRTKVSVKSITPRRIFENFPKVTEASPQTKTRKRPSLSLGSTTARLKQSTLNYSRVSVSKHAPAMSQSELLLFHSFPSSSYNFNSSVTMKHIVKDFRAELITFKCKKQVVQTIHPLN